MNFKSILSNWIVRNILLAIAVIVALGIAAQIGLGVLTEHGHETTVPDFTGMSVAQAEKAAKHAGMRTDVVDSIYVKRMGRGAVVRQEPKPGAMVKKGRRVQITINAVTPKKIPMPNLVGYSLRSAMAELDSRGLTLRKLIYVNDIATNNVLRQLYHNSEIQPGRMIPSESKIDLVLGLNSTENVTGVPDVSGQHYRRAIEMIQGNSLNVGNVVFDKKIRTYQDSLNAVVYRQNPGPEVRNIVMGRTVSIYLTLDEEKVPVKTSAE